MQIKTGHHFTPVQLAKNKKCERTKHWPVREKWLLSYSVDGKSQQKMCTLRNPAYARDGKFKEVHCSIRVTQKWEPT